MGAVPAVRIPSQQNEGWIGFDLSEVMAAVGDWPELDWVLRGAYFNGDVTSVWSEGIAVEEQTEQPQGLSITWEQMRRLAGSCRQIIDGTFTGYGKSGSAELSLTAIDSSYWIVWANDERVLDRVRATFVGVEDYEEPQPPQRHA